MDDSTPYILKNHHPPLDTLFLGAGLGAWLFANWLGSRWLEGSFQTTTEMGGGGGGGGGGEGNSASRESISDNLQWCFYLINCSVCMSVHL